MKVAVKPLAAHIGAEIQGLDLAAPVSDEDFDTVRKAFYDHAVIVVRGGPFSDDGHVRLSRRFGELKKLKINAFLGDRRPEIFVVSNIKKDDQYIGAHDAGMFWHSDGPFLETPHGPSALHALEVPTQDGRPLGDTHFVNTAAAYDGPAGTDEAEARWTEGGESPGAPVRARGKKRGDRLVGDAAFQDAGTGSRPSGRPAASRHRQEVPVRQRWPRDADTRPARGREQGVAQASDTPVRRARPRQ